MKTSNNLLLGKIVLLNSNFLKILGDHFMNLRNPVLGTPRAPTVSKQPRNLIGTSMPAPLAYCQSYGLLAQRGGQNGGHTMIFFFHALDVTELVFHEFLKEISGDIVPFRGDANTVKQSRKDLGYIGA